MTIYNRNISIALDLDKTLANYESKWKAAKIGEPIAKMVEYVKSWQSKGYKVTLFTARLSHKDEAEVASQKIMIQKFLDENNLKMEMTCIKHTHFTHFIDDKAYHVIPNTGEIENVPEELKL